MVFVLRILYFPLVAGGPNYLSN